MGNGKPGSSQQFWGELGSTLLSWIFVAGMIAGAVWLFLGSPDLGKLFSGNPVDKVEHRQPIRYDDIDDYEPTDQQIEQAQRESWERVTGQRWSCFYDPTMNNNWHDDVVCTDGPTSHRPLLLTDYSFVTEQDMRAAAQEHENYLNAGGTP